MYVLLLLLITFCQANDLFYLQEAVESHTDKLSSLVPYQARTDRVYRWFEDNRQAIDDVINWYDTQSQNNDVTERLQSLESRLSKTEERLYYTNQIEDSEELRALERDEAIEERLNTIGQVQNELKVFDKKLGRLESAYNSLAHQEKIAAVEKKLTGLENLLEKHDEFLEGSGSGFLPMNLKERTDSQIEDRLEARLKKFTDAYQIDKDMLIKDTQNKLADAIEAQQAVFKSYVDNQTIKLREQVDQMLQQSLKTANDLRQEILQTARNHSTVIKNIKQDTTRQTNILQAKQDQLSILITNHSAELRKLRTDVPLLEENLKGSQNRMETIYRNLTSDINKLALLATSNTDSKPVIPPEILYPPQPLRLLLEKTTPKIPFWKITKQIPFAFLGTKPTPSIRDVMRPYFNKPQIP